MMVRNYDYFNQATSLLSKKYSAWIVLFLSLSATAIGYYLHEQTYQTRVTRRFEARIADTKFHAYERLKEYNYILRSLSAFISTDKNPSALEWYNFVQGLELKKYAPEIIDVGASGEVSIATNNAKINEETLSINLAIEDKQFSYVYLKFLPHDLIRTLFSATNAELFIRISDSKQQDVFLLNNLIDPSIPELKRYELLELGEKTFNVEYIANPSLYEGVRNSSPPRFSLLTAILIDFILFAIIYSLWWQKRIWSDL